MATLTEQLVNGISRLHNKEDFLYVSLDEGGFGDYVIRIYDDKSGQGLEMCIHSWGLGWRHKELLRHSTKQHSWQELVEDIKEGAESLVSQGYKIRTIVNELSIE
ncbi:hypothetical protein KY312_00070 [Candidatus Woesearchaeota archaeon]|nr:hypothetical protein [Candidatus Woesearchaeota archaeon]